MKLIIPERHRKSKSKPKGKPERAARAAFDRLKKTTGHMCDDWNKSPAHA
ncbi:hypothetical protein OPZ14_001718 [Salmonella enterica subsp. enterica]|nr:hypothetical protein [Salmonella enterica subsp. enterica]EKC4148765.1 hypothetical protein [Salmonella enterica subsp. enterica]